MQPEDKFDSRIPKELFKEDGHYMGKPANYQDRIILRRLRLTEQVPNFVGKEFTLLDIGCGNGASLLQIAPKMKWASGIDITDQHHDLLTSYAEHHHIDNFDFKVVDVVQSKPEKQYDRIISFEVIEHLTSEDGVKYYFDALKEGGKIAISVPNKWWIFETHGAKLPLLPWNRVPYFSWLPRPLHERWANARIYTKRRIIKLMEKHGFTVNNCYYVTAPMDVLPDGKFKNWVIRNFFSKDITKNPFKATSLFLEAEKKTKH